MSISEMTSQVPTRVVRDRLEDFAAIASEMFPAALALAKDESQSTATRRRARIVAKNLNLVLSDARKSELGRIEITKPQD